MDRSLSGGDFLSVQILTKLTVPVSLLTSAGKVFIRYRYPLSMSDCGFIDCSQSHIIQSKTSEMCNELEFNLISSRSFALKKYVFFLVYFKMWLCFFLVNLPTFYFTNKNKKEPLLYLNFYVIIRMWRAFFFIAVFLYLIIEKSNINKS